MLDPLRPEPYLYGLQLAQSVGDLDGIRWSSLGILKQAWPRDKQAAVVQSAARAAADVVAQLKAAKTNQRSGRASRPKSTRPTLATAWSRSPGRATPTSTFWSRSRRARSARFDNPRTTGGGVILGDTRGHRAAAARRMSETYVCPEAFNGTYRVADSPRLGQGDRRQSDRRRLLPLRYERSRSISATRCPLGDQDALVVFDLQGRPPQASRWPSSNWPTPPPGRSRSTRPSWPSSSIRWLARSRPPSNLAASRRGLLGFPFIQQAVGYMPVITVLPTGARLLTTGVISADRRYVRISPSPFFTSDRPGDDVQPAAGRHRHATQPQAGRWRRRRRRQSAAGRSRSAPASGSAGLTTANGGVRYTVACRSR